MRNGSPDEKLFERTVGELIENARGRSSAPLLIAANIQVQSNFSGRRRR